MSSRIRQPRPAAARRSRAHRLTSLLLPLLFVSATLASAAEEGPGLFSTRNFFGEGVTFDHPLLFAEVPGTDSTYLVVQQFGKITLIGHDGNAWQRSTFDSIAVGVRNSRNNDDAGLLGFAFHPDYAENGKYYVYYTQDYAISPRPGTLILSERTADSSLRASSGDPERVLLALRTTRVWHNGGTLKFGPDGMLYLAIGDGGGSGNPDGHAQNPEVLFGKMLRIDVDGTDAFPNDTTRNYAIPEDNPFLDSAGHLPEIWAVGLRSPWKWDFHPETGEIWLGDVGQGGREEITKVPVGGDLGWSQIEGFRCFPQPCPDTMTAHPFPETVPPLFDLDREHAISVTGGTFFTEDSAHALHHAYVFADYGLGTVWVVPDTEADSLVPIPVAEVPSVVSVDRDSLGRVFLVSLQTGIWSDPPPTWTNTGTVHILEIDDSVPPVPVVAQVRQQDRPAGITLAELQRNRDRYVLRGLDGRTLTGSRIPAGMILVYDKKAPRSAPRLFHGKL